MLLFLFLFFCFAALSPFLNAPAAFLHRMGGVSLCVFLLFCFMFSVLSCLVLFFVSAALSPFLNAPAAFFAPNGWGQSVCVFGFLSCLVLSCLVLSCLVLSCLVLSCLVFVLFLFC